MLTNNVIYRISLVAAGSTLLGSCTTSTNKELKLNHLDGVKPRNVVFILSDDHRYDYMGFLGTIPWLETPCMDRMAREERTSKMRLLLLLSLHPAALLSLPAFIHIHIK